jgi:hypothetical protein
VNTSSGFHRGWSTQKPADLKYLGRATNKAFAFLDQLGHCQFDRNFRFKKEAQQLYQ